MQLQKFITIEYSLHLAVDVFFVVLGWAVVLLISQSRWSRHLAWAVPAAVNSSLQLAYRIVLNAHHFFRLGTPMFVFVASRSLWWVSIAIGMYGTWIFWRMLCDIMRQSDAKDLFTQMTAADAVPGIWPPPPMRMKE